MKYYLERYRQALREYRKQLGFLAKKTILIEFPFSNKRAYYSLAPLSNALHELDADLSVSLHEGESTNLKILEHFWQTYMEMNSGKKNHKTEALKEFINAAGKKIGKGKLKAVLKEPDAWISAEKDCFVVEFGQEICFVPFRSDWFKERKKKALQKTVSKILGQGFALKKGERFSIGFELVPAKKDLELPLNDYLDNFPIAMAMALAAGKKGAGVSMGSGTARKSKTEPMNRIAELKTIISGCEYDKKVNEPVFRKYAVLSKKLRAWEWENADAVFSIIGKGYAGKHLFGTRIGYPSLDRKTRWPSPGAMFLKPWWNPQSKIDSRKPKTRLGITETLPIENFVRACNIDYKKMRARNEAIKKAVEKSNKIIVRGIKVRGGRTELEVLIGKGKKKRIIMKSDSDARNKIDRRILKEKGILAGMYANYPGGEAFLTPESINGRAIGDVVINIDRSYVLSEKNPIVVEFNNGKWKLKKAPAKIKGRIEKELRDVKKLINEYEKNKALPAEIIKQYRENFKRVGEFAINTNPKAKLGNYLIENEKIARMLHIALGSGFEPDRQTLYHWDFVINSPRQKLDIYGIDSKERKHWIVRKGKFVL